MITSHFVPVLGQASTELFSPLLIFALCIVGGIGTILLLPGKHEPTLRRIGGAIVVVVALITLGTLAAASVEAFHLTSAIYFWLFAGIGLVGAIRVVTHPLPVYSALYFVLTVFATAGLFVLLEAEFLAAALILIYAGAILITYLFVIMLASQSSGEGVSPGQLMVEYDQVSREPLAASAVGFALIGVLLFIIFDRAGQIVPPTGAALLADGKAPVAIAGTEGATQQLGLFLFRSQLIQLELAGLILTLAMVGAMVLARRQALFMQPLHRGKHAKPEVLVGPATPVDDNPHSIPVYGTDNPRQKAFPQT